MKNKIVAIILGIALISLASAISSGECLSIDLSELESQDNVFYTVVGNSSNLDGLDINLDGTNATICTPLNYKPDDFTIVFFNREKEIIYHYSDGGGSNTIYRDVEKIVEVDKYIDGEVETPIGSEEEVERETMPLIVWIIVGCIIIGGLVWVGFKIKKSREYDEDE